MALGILAGPAGGRARQEQQEPMAQGIGEQQHAAPQHLLLKGHEGEHRRQGRGGTGRGQGAGQGPQGQGAQQPGAMEALRIIGRRGQVVEAEQVQPDAQQDEPQERFPAPAEVPQEATRHGCDEAQDREGQGQTQHKHSRQQHGVMPAFPGTPGEPHHQRRRHQHAGIGRGEQAAQEHQAQLLVGRGLGHQIRQLADPAVHHFSPTLARAARNSSLGQ